MTQWGLPCDLPALLPPLRRGVQPSMLPRWHGESIKLASSLSTRLISGKQGYTVCSARASYSSAVLDGIRPWHVCCPLYLDHPAWSLKKIFFKPRSSHLHPTPPHLHTHAPLLSSADKIEVFRVCNLSGRASPDLLPVVKGEGLSSHGVHSRRPPRIDGGKGL